MSDELFAAICGALVGGMLGFAGSTLILVLQRIGDRLETEIAALDAIEPASAQLESVIATAKHHNSLHGPFDLWGCQATDEWLIAFAVLVGRLRGAKRAVFSSAHRELFADSKQKSGPPGIYDSNGNLLTGVDAFAEYLEITIKRIRETRQYLDMGSLEQGWRNSPWFLLQLKVHRMESI